MGFDQQRLKNFVVCLNSCQVFVLRLGNSEQKIRTWGGL